MTLVRKLVFKISRFEFPSLCGADIQVRLSERFPSVCSSHCFVSRLQFLVNRYAADGEELQVADPTPMYHAAQKVGDFVRDFGTSVIMER